MRGLFAQVNSFMQELNQIPFTFAILEGKIQLINEEEAELFLTISLGAVPPLD